MKLTVILLLALEAAAAAQEVVKRDVPDYDGRGEEPTTVGDVALWVPRVAFAPLYLATEFAVRRPTGWLVVNAERGRWHARIYDFFTTADHKAGFVPTFYLESGFQPVVGLYLFADDVGTAGHALRFSGSLGVGHRALSVVERLRRGGMTISLNGQASDRDDYSHYGVGPTTEMDDRARYGAQRLQISGSVEGRAGPIRVRAELGFRDVELRSSACCDDPSLAVASKALVDGGSSGAFERIEVGLDTRSHGSGLTAELDLEHGTSWNRVTASASANLGVGRGRVLSVGLSGGMVDGAGGEEVPVTELVSVGGAGPLPGFAAGRLVGQSAIAAVAQYEWPVSAWLNGALHVGVGDVFGEHFDGFDPDLMRLSAGLGFRTGGNSSDFRFEALVALGTDTFADGAGVEAVRLVLGGSHAF